MAWSCFVLGRIRRSFAIFFKSLRFRSRLYQLAPLFFSSITIEEFSIISRTYDDDDKHSSNGNGVPMLSQIVTHHNLVSVLDNSNHDAAN
jgi:hypothetical protein